MRPESGANWPPSWEISVVLPAPFGPMIACSSPVSTASVRSSVATTPSKRLARCSTCSSGSPWGALCADLRQQPVDPPRANSTTSSSSGPRMICQYSVHAGQRTSSSTSSATAPISGPNTEPMPPSTTMMMRSPERVQIHHRRADEVGVVGDQRAGKPAQRSGDDEAGRAGSGTSESRSPACAGRWSASPAPPCRSANSPAGAPGRSMQTAAPGTHSRIAPCW